MFRNWNHGSIVFFLTIQMNIKLWLIILFKKIQVFQTYYNVWNKHQYWMDIIYMESFFFLASFSFWSVRIWHFILFLLHFGFRFSMKGVLLWCLMGVHVDRTIIQKNNCLGIDICEFVLHMVHEKKCKNANSNHKVPTFWE
jgi:hypothetical protein